jgi:hypothetical protein
VRNCQADSRSEDIGAGDGIRTRDINLGKVALYQLSYSRMGETFIFYRADTTCQTLSYPGGGSL